MEIFSSFDSGDLQLLYYREGNLLDLCLIPASMKDRIQTENMAPESMIQFKLSGTPFGNKALHTLRNSPCLNGLKFLFQKHLDSKVITHFQYGEGLFFDHIAELHDGWIRVWIEIKNQSGCTLKFDQLCSFSLGMISPFGESKILLERVTERWHHEEISRERAGMERANSLRFGTNGTLPVSQYYPFAGIEDRNSGVLWGVQLENSGSWMLEFSSSGKNMTLSGGMPDLAYCGQTISVSSGTAYHTPTAVLTGVKGDILDLFNRLCRSQCPGTTSVPVPVYYGPFSLKTLQFIKECGIRYYVPDHELNTIEVARIADAGLIPGVTLDMETVLSETGNAAILTQNGLPVQSGKRFFLDHRDPARRNAVLNVLCEKLKKHHIGYVKLLCMASFCGGCDGIGSPMENQQQYTDSIYDFYAELRREMPNLVIEISSPETGRFSARWLTLADMVTSAAELPDAALTMAALDRQMLTPSFKSGIVLTLHPGDELYGKLNSSLLGRPILTGDIAALSESEKKILKEFLSFYEKALPVLRNGSYRLGHIIGDSCTDPVGWQVFIKNTHEMQLLIFHAFSAVEPVTFDIPAGMQSPSAFFGTTAWQIHGQKLKIEADSGPASAAFLFVSEFIVRKKQILKYDD